MKMKNSKHNTNSLLNYFFFAYLQQLVREKKVYK